MTWDIHKWEGKDRISQREMPLKNKVKKKNKVAILAVTYLKAQRIHGY